VAAKNGDKAVRRRRRGYNPGMSTPVLDDALRLPVPERIEFVQAIWDSIVAESALVAVTDEQRAELDRRRADAASNPTDERPWSEVRSSPEHSR
jgi:putative addiction module component (TIGR02574 family)